MKPKHALNRVLGLTASGLVISAAVLTSPASAVTVQEIPNPRATGGWVSDTAGIISAEAEADLNRLIDQLEAETSAEMAVVTVEETAPAATPKAFATELFNHWGIGKAEANNGILFLVSVGDRRAEVDVGTGLESVLTQQVIEQILQKEAVPRFKQERYNRGIVKASQALIAELNPNAEPLPASPSNTIKILIISSGTAAFLLHRFARSWLTKPKSLSPGSQQAVGFIDVAESAPELVNVAVGFGSGFSLGAIAAMLTGIGAPWFGGSLAGIVGIGLLATKDKKSSRFICEDCDVPLEALAENELYPKLSKAQQVATNLGSKSFRGWACPSCNGLSLRSSRHWSSYRQCYRCQEPTVSSSRSVIRRATHHHSGEAEIRRTCHCCGHSEVETVVLAQLTENHSHSNYSGSSSSSGGSGGSFGGGSSGGGGGGASW